MPTVTPADLVQRHLDTLVEQMPGVFDGDVESVHQARVAIRRLHEVWPLADDLEDRHSRGALKRARRGLGRVRDLDVMSSVLANVGSRIPPSAGQVLLAAQRATGHRQTRARRQLVKTFERTDFPALRDSVAKAHGGWRRHWTRVYALRGGAWVETLWDRIASRSTDARAAAERAPATYFPNRSHRVRVAVKKLRYAIEVAVATNLWSADRVLKDLRRIQGILGDLHDAQVLIDELDDLAPQHAESAESEAVKDLLAADIARLYAAYVQRRKRISQIAEVCDRTAARAGTARPGPLVAASVIAASLIVPFARQRLTGASARPATPPIPPVPAVGADKSTTAENPEFQTQGAELQTAIR